MTEAFARIYLDSNIVISLFTADRGPEVARVLADMIGAVRPSSRQPFATSELTLSECLVRAIRIGSSDDAQSIDNIIMTNDWLEVGPVDRQVLMWAAATRSSYAHLKLPDAIHVATAIQMQCTHILSADTGIRDVYVLKAPPWNPGPDSLPLRVLRPDPETLRAIIAWLEGR